MSKKSKKTSSKSVVTTSTSEQNEHELSPKFIAILKFYHDSIEDERESFIKKELTENFPSKGEMKLRFTAAHRKVTPARKMDERTAKQTGHTHYNGGRDSVEYKLVDTEVINFTREQGSSLLSYARKYWKEPYVAFQVALENTSQGVSEGKTELKWSNHYDYFGMSYLRFNRDHNLIDFLYEKRFGEAVDGSETHEESTNSLDTILKVLGRLSPQEKHAFMVVMEELKPYPMNCSTPENQKAISRAFRECCGWGDMQTLREKLYPYD
jgi:hypothetical protein